MHKQIIEDLATAISIEIAHRYNRFFSGAEDDLFELVKEIITEEVTTSK